MKVLVQIMYPVCVEIDLYEGAVGRLSSIMKHPLRPTRSSILRRARGAVADDMHDRALAIADAALNSWEFGW